MILAMTKLLRLLPLLALGLTPLFADEDPSIVAVRQADDARVAATIAADGAKLDAIFSDSLNYAHSSGAVNNKAQYMDAIVSGKTKYQSIVFEDRKFTVAGPGVVIITGKCQVHVVTGGKPNQLHLSFLDVWHLENGAWRFLAWQSNHLTP
jgi:hypothetical protein